MSNFIQAIEDEIAWTEERIYSIECSHDGALPELHKELKKKSSELYKALDKIKALN